MGSAPNDASPQANGASSTNTRWGLRAGYVSTLIQGLAIYLAFSILLGRIYFLKYFDTLGIPLSDVDVHITDYSIVSPDVAIVGVGSALVWPVLLFLQRTSIQPRRKWLFFVIGALLVCISVGLEFLPEFLATETRDSFGSSGISELLAVVLSMFGGAFMALGLLHLGAIVIPTDPAQRARDASTVRQIIPLFLLLVAVYVVFTTSRYSNQIAELDAERSLAESPVAMLELAASHLNCPNQETWLYSKNGTAFGNFAVVFIGKRFVYLRPSETNSEAVVPHLYAVPAEDIKTITYIQPPVR